MGKIGRFSKWELGVLFAFVLFVLFLWAKGYPKPHRDDLLFIGTPIWYCQTGEFINPFCRGFLAQFGSLKHYFYMPLMSFLLREWLCIGGISAQNILLFQWFFYLLGMFSVYFFFLKTFKLPFYSALFLSFAYLIVIVQMGLRPDACGFGLAWAGLALLNSKKFWPRCLGFTLCGAGFMAAPLSLGTSFPLAFYVLINEEKRPLKSYLETLSIAIGACLSLFLFIIDFELQEFLQIFIRHTQFLGAERSSWTLFFQIITSDYELFLKFPLYLTTISISLIVVFSQRADERKMVLSLLACLALSGTLYAEKTALFSGIFICWALLTVCFNVFKHQWQKMAYISFLAALLLLSQSTFILPLLFQKGENPEQIAAIKREIKDEPFVSGDAAAARFIYDYRLPATFQNLNFYTSVYYPPALNSCKRNEIWLYSPGFAYMFIGKQADNGISSVTLAGKKFRSIPVYPNDITLYRCP